MNTKRKRALAAETKDTGHKACFCCYCDCAHVHSEKWKVVNIIETQVFKKLN